jgi:hypothetical protein
VSLVAAAVCPHPPVLVPEVAAGAAPELADLRAACDAAVTTMLAAAPRRVVLVGSGPSTTEFWFPYEASFARWGAPVTASLGARRARPYPLPLSLAVGVWLLRRSLDAGVTRPTGVSWAAFTVAPDASPAECAALGARIVARGPVGLLVLGDGSACRGVTAPGYDDPRAAPFDAAAARAFAAADPDALLALDPALAAELRVAGRAPWQVLAGAAAAPGRGRVSYDAAPYGVAYLVATWTPAG